LVVLGLRPGELFARRWQDWQSNRLMIQSAVYRGEVGDTKTEGSKGFVWLPKILQQDLAFYRLTMKHCECRDFIFSARQGVPMDTHNYLRRILKPLCDKLGVEGVTHQCLRRTCSTYLLPHGTVKDIQAHLRHASSRTTLDIYTKDIPESVQSAVEGMAELLFPVAQANGRVN
jgi:integrase